MGNESHTVESKVETPKKKKKEESVVDRLEQELDELQEKFIEHVTKNRDNLSSKTVQLELAPFIRKMDAIHTKLGSNDFTKWTLPEVLSQYSLDDVPSIDFTSGCRVQAKHLNTAQEIKDSWLSKSSIFLSSPRRKSFFISDFIEKTLNILKISLRVILDEILEEGVGPVDFVFHDVERYTPLIIIEAKKDDFDQGEAQILLALSSALTQEDRNVFGFVTNSVLCVPYVYTTEGNFFKDNGMLIPPFEPSINDIGKVVSTMEWMCTRGLTTKFPE